MNTLSTYLYCAMLQLYEQFLDLEELHISGAEVHSDMYILYVGAKRKQGTCPCCGHKCQDVHQYYQRSIEDLPMDGKMVLLVLEVRQFKCNQCDQDFVETFRFARPHETLTRRYENYLYYHFKKTDRRHIADLRRIDWEITA